ncbi:ATP-binding protein [Thalassotalea piscium]
MASIKYKNQLVSSYHISIILVFVVLVLTAFVLAGVQYFNEFDVYKKNQYQALNKETTLLNNILSHSVDALLGMRDFANYYLDNPDELSATFPSLLQDKDRFYLKKVEHDVIKYRQPLTVNITGIGQLSSLTPQVKEELTMARALAPAFIAAEKSNDAVNWFYYVSFSKFISLYPWISRDTWQYSTRTLNNPQMEEIRSARKGEDKIYWSMPYEDAAEKGLNTAVAAAVFRDEEVKGAVLLDISLGKIHEKLAVIEKSDHGVAIIDKKDNILVHKTIANKKILGNDNKHTDLPPEFIDLTYQSLVDYSQGMRIGKYFVQYMHVPLNDWVILTYRPYEDVMLEVTSQFVGSLILSISALLTLLIIIYVVTRRTFIKPTQQFISHIAYSAKGDHGKIKPPAGWDHWFELVEDIFSQNRSLLQQLKDQNKVLDIRVSEKTQALKEKSDQHQYDYAILRSVMDAIPDYLIFNDLEHKVIGCNFAFERLTGITESHMLAKNVGELLPAELGAHLNGSEDFSHTEKGSLNIIKTLENTYEVFIEPFYNTDKVMLGTIIIIRDVTEQTAITSALEQAKIQAEKANLAKSQFLANMSHEIRTPINAIQGMHFLLKQSGLSSSQRIHLGNAEIASTALLHLVNELLDLAKVESGNMSIVKASCNIDRIVDQAVKLNIGTVIHKKLQLYIDIKADVPQQVITDEMRLVQVLSNLINNAVKFTHQGSISLVIENIGLEQNNALVKFSVKDTGIGIAKDKQANLFEAFHQGDESMTRQYGGSGLGLSICRHIVDLLDGDITLVSDTNQGADFSFVLPISVDVSHHNRLQLNTKYAFINVSVDLPECFSEHLHVNDNACFLVKHLAEIKNQTQFKAPLPLVLFINSDLFTEKDCQLAADLMLDESVNISLFVLCQDSYQVNNNQALTWFDEQQLPYVVCEKPMYRYCLLQIFDVLRAGVPSIMPATQTESLDTLTQDNKTDLAGLTILLVEDNLVNQLVAKELLLSMKADVVIAENGQVALDLLMKSLAVDVILMDIQMPVMDGLTAAKAIRQLDKYADIPIVAMTAHARDEDRKQSIDAGMNMHISKPVTAELLRNSILSFF